MNKAIFLDKDGTLIPDLPYNVNPALIDFFQETPKALSCLKEMGFMLIVISNQPGVARGYFSEEKLNHVSARLQQLAKMEGFQFDGFYYCTHDVHDNCSCRKPLPGLIFKASTLLEIDRYNSWLIGDILNDIEAGNAAGCRTILIDNGGETEWMINPKRIPYYICKNLIEATEFIGCQLKIKK